MSRESRKPFGVFEKFFDKRLDGKVRFSAQSTREPVVCEASEQRR